MPLSVLMIFFNAIVIVVVFIPPPVDKGEAPIHINRRVRNKVDGRREVRSTVLKPAVRGVTALKKDTASFPLNGSPLRQLLFSDNQKSKVPPTRSSKVAVMTIRVVVFTILTGWLSSTVSRINPGYPDGTNCPLKLKSRHCKRPIRHGK